MTEQINLNGGYSVTVESLIDDIVESRLSEINGWEDGCLIHNIEDEFGRLISQIDCEYRLNEKSLRFTSAQDQIDLIWSNEDEEGGYLFWNGRTVSGFLSPLESENLKRTVNEVITFGGAA